MTATSKKAIYTGRVRTEGSREGGVSRSDDGHLAITHAAPGKPGGTNPEQLLAAGWTACFQGAMGLAARQMKVDLPATTAIEAEVDLCHDAGDGYSLQVRFDVSVPGLPREVVELLVKAAHETCPYSKATRGNIPVTLTIV